MGTQYRSAIFYSSEEEKSLAEQMIQELDASKTYESPVVTEVVPLGQFYTAESYHHDYYANHKDEPYCNLVIAPKIEKMQKRFSELLQ